MPTNRSAPPIDWHHPPPRNVLDHLVGPGATRAELLLQLVPPPLATAGWVAAAVIGDWGWSPLQLVVVGVLVFDLVGGVITNATGAAKRWYHRPGQGPRQHLGFVLLHVAQPLLVVLLFDPGNWAFLGGSFGYALAGAAILLATPQYLRRPLAGLLLVLGFFLALYVVPVPPRFEWFLPVYFMKLLQSHLLREEPYRAPGAAEPAAGEREQNTHDG